MLKDCVVEYSSQYACILEKVVQMPDKTVIVEDILSDMVFPGIALQCSQTQSLTGALAVVTRLTSKYLLELKITRELLYTWRQKNDINHCADI